MNILIVEDNDINAKVLELMLRNLDFDYTTSFAENADKALSIIDQKEFDLILMDINLGDGQMTGTEVMQELKQRDSHKDIPMYAVTCYSLPGDKEKFLAAGFDKYISKPINQEELLKEVHAERNNTH